MIHEGKEKCVKGYHAKDWFEWWMKGKIERNLNIALVGGLLEEKEPDRNPFDLDKLMNY